MHLCHTVLAMTDAMPTELTPHRLATIVQASQDFFFFQNRGYPRTSALEWVGNRHGLIQGERQLLLRGVFSQETALRRRARRCSGESWIDHPLVVDGHNVQITVESAILGRPLLKANDGALRDLAGQSARFRLTEASEVAQDWIFGFLGEFRPKEVLFLFDAPMSHSGLLAEQYRRRLRMNGLRGASRAVPVPESEIPARGCIAAGSDQAVIDSTMGWLDLAHAAIEWSSTLQLLADFGCLTSSRDPVKDLPAVFPWC
jgi:hypothetical protein